MIPSHWRPSLRMARRDIRRHKARAVLSLLLVTLPVLVATVVSLFVHNTQWRGEQMARTAMGGADAIVEITPFSKAKSNISYGDLESSEPRSYDDRSTR
jgi:putative ABC transport system permease protein